MSVSKEPMPISTGAVPAGQTLHLMIPGPTPLPDAVQNVTRYEAAAHAHQAVHSAQQIPTAISPISITALLGPNLRPGLRA